MMQDQHAAWMRAMRAGDYLAAWAISDQVLRWRDQATRDDPSLPYHQRWVWNGDAVDGRRVLVRCYHGLGDTVQFARFLPALCRRAASVTVEAQPELLPLLRSIEGPRFIPFDRSAPVPAHECTLEIMELGHALRQFPADAPPPYVDVPHHDTQRAASIGLCWQAGDWDTRRSVPFHDLAPLFHMPNPLFSLQPSPAPAAGIFENPEGCPAPIEGTAALLTSLDLIITVDSMVAHLAGALGRRTWLLLQRDADWRWMTGADSPWYPSMTLFRQETQGDWRPVIADVVSQLNTGMRRVKPRSVTRTGSPPQPAHRLPTNQRG